MLESLLGIMLEIVIETVGGVAIAFFKMENAAGLAGALFGLTCIAVGAASYWSGQ